MKEHIQYVPTEPKGCFLDYTYCASTDCKNDCGSKMSDSIKEAVDKMKHCRVAFSYFCGED